jgi:hypothetical protein
VKVPPIIRYPVDGFAPTIPRPILHHRQRGCSEAYSFDPSSIATPTATPRRAGDPRQRATLVFNVGDAPWASMHHRRLGASRRGAPRQPVRSSTACASCRGSWLPAQQRTRSLQRMRKAAGRSSPGEALPEGVSPLCFQLTCAYPQREYTTAAVSIGPRFIKGLRRLGSTTPVQGGSHAPGQGRAPGRASDGKLRQRSARG